jgi:hypothetical protein
VISPFQSRRLIVRLDARSRIAEGGDRWVKTIWAGEDSARFGAKELMNCALIVASDVDGP